MPAEPTLLTDDEVSRFIADGFIVLQTDCEPALHSDIDHRLREVAEHESWHGNNILPRMPELYEILNCPRVRGALVSLLGPDYLLHPHRAIHRSTPVEDSRIELDTGADAPPMGKGSTAGSAWHQDAQSPLARARHHVPRFIIGFYFPHDTPAIMGPTRLQAGSHLWPHPFERPDGVVMPDLVPAGTFMLVHFDIVHAGFTNRAARARYMLKFVFSRMSAPLCPTWANERAQWRAPPGNVGLDLQPAWRSIWDWMRGEPSLPGSAGRLDDLAAHDYEVSLNAVYSRFEPMALAARLRARAGQDLHERRLVKPEGGRQYVKDDIGGYPRRWNERAIVMEPEAYALALQGEGALDALASLVEPGDPWLDVNVAFALGELGVVNDRVAGLLEGLLASKHQQVVRQAVDAVSFVQGDATRLLDAFDALMSERRVDWQQKEVERGWTAMDQIRLNVMFACVSLLSTNTDKLRLQELLLAGLDDRGYCAQVAVEGLRRLGTPTALDSALEYAAQRAWDAGLLGSARAY